MNHGRITRDGDDRDAKRPEQGSPKDIFKRQQKRYGRQQKGETSANCDACDSANHANNQRKRGTEQCWISRTDHPRGKPYGRRKYNDKTDLNDNYRQTGHT